MKRFRTDIIAIGILLFLVIIYFLRLFYPEPSLIVTPDFGRSDAWHFSFATKYVLWESLRAHQLPFWRNDLGGGFPLFAEGQTGALFLPNLILFYLFPPVIAYNLALVSSILILAIGMYWWMRLLTISVYGALFAAITVGFSALPILQLPHITLLQGISLLPVLGALTTCLITKGSRLCIALFALVLTQQIFAGFPQATFLTLLLCGSYVLWISFTTKRPMPAIHFGIAVFLGIFGGAAQLLPSWEFLRESTFPHGFDQNTASMFSMPLKHLLTFVSPYILGNPKVGSYPPFTEFNGSIFWENTAYVGIIPLLLLVSVIFKRKIRPVIYFFGAVTIISLLLAWGKHSPLYLVYAIWPMNLFRVPSRFLWLTIVSMGVISGFGIDLIRMTIKKDFWRRTLVIGLLILHPIQLFASFWSFHMLVPAVSWMSQPTTATMLSPEGRLLTVGAAGSHKTFFLHDGWKHTKPFVTLRDGIAPNSNVLWGIPQAQVYAGRQIKRLSIMDGLLEQSFSLTEKSATVSAHTFFDLLSIRNILSFVPITSEHIIQAGQWSDSDNNLTIRLYNNTKALPRAYLVQTATQAATLSEAAAIFESSSFVPRETTLLESHEILRHPELNQLFTPRDPDLSKLLPLEVHITTDTHQKISILARDITKPSLLILTDNNYPGWQADLDGNRTPIFTANLTQRAVFVPTGTHTITFRFLPTNICIGFVISSVVFVITVFLGVARFGALRHHTPKKTGKRLRHRESNRDR